MGYPREEIKHALAFLASASFSYEQLELAHSVASFTIKQHREYRAERTRCQALLTQAQVLFRQDCDERKVGVVGERL